MKTTLLLVAVLLSACASVSPVQIQRKNTPVTAGKPFPKRITFWVTHSREAGLEPCGCSMAPAGGVKREYNLVRKWKKDLGDSFLMYLSGGTTLVLPPNEYSFKKKAFNQAKARYIVKGLGALGLQVLSPTANDFLLGNEFIQQLRRESDFNWVSANLKIDGNPVFSPYLRYPFEGGEIVVTGISGEFRSKYMGDLPPGLKVTPPADALREVLDQLGQPSGKRMLVVLTDLPEDFRENLMAEFPQVNLVFGGFPGESTFTVHQFSGGTLYAVPSDLARAMARLKIEVGDKYPFRFYNGRTAAVFKEITRTTYKELSEARTALKNEKDPAKKRKLDEMEKLLTTRFKRYSGIPVYKEPGVSLFTPDMEGLSDRYEKPRNPMDELVKQYKEEVRRIALQDSKEKSAGVGPR